MAKTIEKIIIDANHSEIDRKAGWAGEIVGVEETTTTKRGKIPQVSYRTIVRDVSGEFFTACAVMKANHGKAWQEAVANAVESAKQ